MGESNSVCATRFLAFLFLAFLPLAAAAQDRASLRGTVRTAEDDRLLQGANVVLESPAGVVAHATATGPAGTYVLTGILPGRYPVSISYVGYTTFRDTLALAAGSQTLDVALRVEERALDQVTVEAPQGAARRQAGLQTVRPAEIERIPTPGPSGDLVAYMQTLPGIVSGGDRGGQLYIRGGTPSQNLVLVDGIPVVKPFHISGLYSAFPEEVVSSADIYSGGFSARYMGAISSAIDVSLRNGNMERYEGSASASPFIVSAHVEGPVREQRSSFLGVVRHSVIEEAAGPLLGREVPLRFYDATLRFAVQGESSGCSLTALRTYDRGRIDPALNTVLSWSNTALGGRCRTLNEEADRTLTLAGGYTRFQNDAGTGGAPERSSGLWKGFAAVTTTQGFSSLSVATGVRTEYTQYEYALDEKFIVAQAQDQYQVTLQAYAAAEWKPGDWLTVSPSVGTHFTGELDTATLEPRLRLAVRPGGSDRQELSLAVGKYNQLAEGITDERDAGTVFTIWVPSLRDDPLPQAVHGIAGYRQRIGRAFEASVEGYVKDMKYIPVPRWTPQTRFNTRTVLADGFAYGADVRAEIDARPFYLYLGYGWSRLTYEASTGDLGAWIEGTVFEYPPAHDLRHQLNAVAGYELAGFTANLSWEYGSGRPFTQVYGFDLGLRLSTLQEYPTRDAGTPLTLYAEPYGARLPPYHRLDVSVSRPFDLGPRLSLETKGGAVNAYDRRNIFYYDVNTLRRIDQTPLLPYVSLRLIVE